MTPHSYVHIHAYFVPFHSDSMKKKLDCYCYQLLWRWRKKIHFYFSVYYMTWKCDDDDVKVKWEKVCDLFWMFKVTFSMVICYSLIYSDLLVLVCWFFALILQPDFSFRSELTEKWLFSSWKSWDKYFKLSEVCLALMACTFRGRV